MTPKRILPSNLRKELSPQNKVWLENYRTEGKDPPGYYPNVQEFLEFCAFNSEKDISKIGKIETDAYIEALKNLHARPPTINGRLSAISGFRYFLISKHPDIFSEKFLSDLPGHERIDLNPTEIKPLNLEQLSYARKYNHRSLINEYIFELFFQFGIDKNDLIACKFPENRNPRLDEIISKVPKGDVTDGTINNYFAKVSEYLQKQGVYDKKRRNINSYDLAESHKAYFLRCPNCGLVFENIVQNWVLSRVKFDRTDLEDEFRIVCAQCKGVGMK